MSPEPATVAYRAPISPISSASGAASARAGLEDVRIHDLRHNYASRALSLGEGLPMIGRLLGHRQVETTARYAHLADESVRAAARISNGIAALVLPDYRPNGDGEVKMCSGGRPGG